MAKTKTKPDKKLYDRLRSSGVRKKVAGRVAEALPSKGSAKAGPARRAAADLSTAVDEIKDRAMGGPRKRSAAAKKAVKTRKAKAAKRSAASKKAAKSRAKKRR
jgi:hypothetical protein